MAPARPPAEVQEARTTQAPQRHAMHEPDPECDTRSPCPPIRTPSV
jgi:hypothetical protein